ncbi:MAG: TetR/AcrR family transcriptional regulator [Balneolaceae bacterium]
MGISERKKREKARRQEAIIDAAEKVILEKGFESAKMTEIAEEAELSKGTLYLYFRNKTALYLAISERGSRKLNSQFHEVLKKDRSGLELIRMLGEAYLNFVNENPIYFNAFSHYENLQDRTLLADSQFAHGCEEQAGEAMGYITRALQKGIDDGSIDDRFDPKELAVMIWASARGIVQMLHLQSSGHYFRILDDMDLNIESLIISFLQLLEAGMEKKK